MRYYLVGNNNRIFFYRYKEQSLVPETTDTDMQQTYVRSSNGMYACFMQIKPESLSFSVIKKVIPDCNGFPLTIIETDSLNQVSLSA